MTTTGQPVLAWLALAAGVLLVPAPAQARVRARALAEPAAVPPHLWSRLPRPRVSAAVSALTVAGVAAVLGATVAGGPALGAAALVLALVGSRLVVDARTRRRRGRAQRDLLAAVRLLVAELESGARPEVALRASADAAAAHSGPLRSAARSAAEGDDAAAVLIEHSSLAPLAHAWRIAGLAGVPLADVLSGVALDLGAGCAQSRAVAVALSAARSTAALLAGLPLLGIGLGAAMGARPVTFLTGSGAGRLVCCAGVVLDALGLLWTQRLARRAELS